MVIMIDHYDSFSNMIKDYIEQLGFNTLMIPTDQVDLQRIKKYQPTHIILGPGPGHPEDASVSMMHQIISRFANKYPILGICLGHQVIASYYGAKVIHAEKIMHGKISRIQHNGDCLFESIPTSFSVTRYHSLMVSPDNFPQSLSITATNKTKNTFEIMSLRKKNVAIWGVQFHPEAALTEHGLKILSNFLSQNV
jgi:anthranilate synthase/aminodeoxychorismate synthase-like glutamine amidotransferase